MAGSSGFVGRHGPLDRRQRRTRPLGRQRWPARRSGPTRASCSRCDTLRTLSKSKHPRLGAAGIQQYPDVNNAFLTGKVPMVQMGTWSRQYAPVDQPHRRSRWRRRPGGHAEGHDHADPFPDVAGKGNPSTLFADPDAGRGQRQVGATATPPSPSRCGWVAPKSGQQVVANNLDAFADAQRGDAAVRQGHARQPERAAALRSKGVTEPRRHGDEDSGRYGISAPAQPGDHRCQSGDGERGQAPGRCRRRHPSRWPTRHAGYGRPDTLEPETRMTTTTGTDDRRDGRTESPRRSSGLHRPPGLPWILPALVVSVGLLYYCIFYTGSSRRSTGTGAAPLPEKRRVGQLCADGAAIRCSGGRSLTPRCSSW